MLMELIVRILQN